MAVQLLLDLSLDHELGGFKVEIALAGSSVYLADMVFERKSLLNGIMTLFPVLPELIREALAALLAAGGLATGVVTGVEDTAPLAVEAGARVDETCGVKRF